MVIELQPETEKRLKQDLASGRFHSVEEVIQRGLQSDVESSSSLKPKESFAKFMRRSPAFGSGIEIDERQAEFTGRDIDL